MIAIHANRVDFVDIGEGVVFLSKVTKRMDRRDIAFHRIDAFKGDQLGRFGVFCCEQFFEVRHIIVTENALRTARIADASDHARVVQFV